MTPNRRLKQARELRGWSQAKVAEQIGTDATTVSRWERGLFSPTPYFRERLCALFVQNAEELGLLETGQLPRLEPMGAVGATGQAATALSSASNGATGQALKAMPSLSGSSEQPANLLSSAPLPEEYVREEEELSEALSTLPAPSWPKRTDTFTYILHSAAHDQQAHLLWEDAYVRALRGQRAEAKRLAEASMNEFERVGHLNAAAVREWLNQRELIAPTSAVPNVTTLPLLGEQHKHPARRAARRRGTGIVLILCLALALMIAGFSFSQLYTTSPLLFGWLRAPTTSTAARISNSLSYSAEPELKSPAPATAGAVATVQVVVTPAPKSVPTATPAPATPSQSASPLTGEASPASLAAQDCASDSLGLRCTLTLLLYTSDSSIQGSYSWQASTSNAHLHIQPTSGAGGQVGHSLQVILYVQATPGQTGTFVFTLAASAVNATATVAVAWRG